MVWLPMVLMLAGGTPDVDVGLQLGAGLTMPDCYAIQQMDMAWYYNWNTTGLGCGIEFVPMHYQTAGWPSQEYPPAYLLMFNEANVPWQHRLEPELAAIEWHQAEREFPFTRLVGPSVAYDQNGLAWLNEWYDAYLRLYEQPPRIYAAAAHCYFAEVADCMAWLETLHEWFGARGAEKLWLTEFSFLPCWYAGSEDESRKRAGELLAWLREQKYIERVAWFATHPMAYGTNGMYWPQGCQTPLADTRALTDYGEWWAEETQVQ